MGCFGFIGVVHGKGQGGGGEGVFGLRRAGKLAGGLFDGGKSGFGERGVAEFFERFAAARPAGDGAAHLVAEGHRHGEKFDEDGDGGKAGKKGEKSGSVASREGQGDAKEADGPHIGDEGFKVFGKERERLFFVGGGCDFKAGGKRQG